MRKGLLFILLMMSVMSCSSKETTQDTPEATFASAKEYEDQDRFEEAIKKYQDVKNKYPYSHLAIDAELAVADVYYKQEAFPEAQVSYQSFKDLHPKHPKSDYVTYRFAMSYYEQLPTTIDRDLTLANNAIQVFDEVMIKFPNSEYVKEAQEKRDKAFHMLAEKEEYIGDFYFKRDNCQSAIGRYEVLVQKYTETGHEAKGLARIAICAHRLGDPTKTQKALSTLELKYPDSEELRIAKKETK